MKIVTKFGLTRDCISAVAAHRLEKRHLVDRMTDRDGFRCGQCDEEWWMPDHNPQDDR